MSSTEIRRRENAAGGHFPSDMHPVLARIYAARGLESGQELEYTLDRLLPFELLGGMDKATELLAKALAEDWQILVVADFDADGATGCAVILRGLRLLGAAHADYLMPNRFKTGYGLTPEVVALARDRDPQLIITVDNGITSNAGVEAAHAAGIQVLVTDHHLPGDELPDADAIVNPNLPGDSFPSKHLAGVGVAFYLLMALRARLREQDWFACRGGEPNLAQLLDLVALGTVADVVPLDYNNRLLVSQGLRRIRADHCQPGIRALLKLSGRQQSQVVASDLGFAVGPRLNAAGRLEDMALGVECLLADNDAAALKAAQTLDRLNRERRQIERDMQESAQEQLQSVDLDMGTLPAGLCIYDEQWHQGVVGILASRLKDRYHRPVVAFANNGPDELRGSARSVKGFHIRDALSNIAARYPAMLGRFGGHAMAAGLSLKQSELAAFQAAFEAEVAQSLGSDPAAAVIWSDGELGAGDIDLTFAEQLRAGGPWGQGFAEPVFDGVFETVSQRIVGEAYLKLKLRQPGSAREIEAICFQAGVEAPETTDNRLHLAYRLDVNSFRGIRSPQLLIEHMGVATPGL